MPENWDTQEADKKVLRAERDRYKSVVESARVLSAALNAGRSGINEDRKLRNALAVLDEEEQGMSEQTNQADVEPHEYRRGDGSTPARCGRCGLWDTDAVHHVAKPFSRQEETGMSECSDAE